MLTAPSVLLAAHAGTAALLAGAAAFGAAAAVLNVLVATSIQREIPDALLSRVMSVVQLVATGLVPVGFALTGPAAAWLGAGRALAFGAGAILVSVGVLLSMPEIRRFGGGSRSAS